MACTIVSLIQEGNKYRNFSRRQLAAIQAYLMNRAGASTYVAPVQSAKGLWVPQQDPQLGLGMLTKQYWRYANNTVATSEDPDVQWALAQQAGYARLPTEELEYLAAVFLCPGAIP